MLLAAELAMISLGIAYRMEKGKTISEEWPVREEQARSDDGGLALLQTCRQVYRECIELLYSQNTFDVNHPQTLAFLERTIRPNRLAAIRSLQLSWKRAAYPRDTKPADLEVKEPHSDLNPDGIHTWWWAYRVHLRRYIKYTSASNAIISIESMVTTMMKAVRDMMILV